MKYFDKLKSLFEKAIYELEYKNIFNKSRKFSEIEYFEAYLHFINNSIHYSRYEYIKNGKVIKGKYINEKVNKWTKYGIFKKMYQYVLYEYKKVNKHTKHLYIDGHIITNKYANQHVGRCVYYKSKYAYNLQSIVDDNGIPFGIFIDKANKDELNMLIPTFNNSYLDDATKYINSKKYKRYFICDAGYDSKKNEQFLKSKGYIPLIWRNFRNTKNKEIIKQKKLNKYQTKHYKTRHIIENSFSWIETKIPRLSKIYDKKIQNYVSLVYMSIMDLIFTKICV